MKHFALGAIVIILGFPVKYLEAQVNNSYHVLEIYHIIAGDEGKDYISISPNNRIYVSHGVRVNVLEEKTGDSICVIPNTIGVHGIAFAPSFDKGYISNGLLNNVSVFDTKTNNVLTQIVTGKDPDCIIYDEFSKKIITCNNIGKDLSIIDPKSDKVVATIPLGANPEAAVSDGNGKIYVNLENKNEIAVINIKTCKVENYWSTEPGVLPTALAIDLNKRRLFVGCDKLLLIVNLIDGKVMDKKVIGFGCDGVVYDSDKNNVFASCADTILYVFHEISENKFNLTDKVKTLPSARTLALDKITHQIFLPANLYDETNKNKRVPGLAILVVVQAKS